MVHVETEDLVFTEFLIGDRFFLPESDVDVSITNLLANTTENFVIGVANTEPMTLAQSYFTVPADRYVSPHRVVLKFTADDAPRRLVQIVDVVKELPLTVSAAKVRSILGVSDEELADNDIDFYRTLTQLRQDLGVDIFADSSQLFNANELLAYAQANHELQSLQLKVLQSQQIDDHRKARATVRFDTLANNIAVRYWELRSQFDPEGALTTVTPLEFIAVPDQFLGDQ